MSNTADSVVVRRATIADAAACLAIYRPFVEATTVSFEAIVPTVEEFAARVEKSLSAWTGLIAEKDGRCIGYAYGATVHGSVPVAKRGGSPHFATYETEHQDQHQDLATR